MADSARVRRVLEGVFAQDSRVTVFLGGAELDPHSYRGKGPGEMSARRVDDLPSHAVDRRVVHARPLASVCIEDAIDSLHVAAYGVAAE